MACLGYYSADVDFLLGAWCYCVKGGPVAWDGELGFWVAGVGGRLQNFEMAFFVFTAILKKDTDGDGGFQAVTILSAEIRV
jgi:hypothetical protein